VSIDILRSLLVSNEVTSGGFRLTLDGELLRRLTAEVGFSMVDLADASRLSRPTLRRAIQGAPITPRSAARIADALSRSQRQSSAPPAPIETLPPGGGA
jgi:transcriptional regulator with XRE-family HTH domain